MFLSEIEMPFYCSNDDGGFIVLAPSRDQSLVATYQSEKLAQIRVAVETAKIVRENAANNRPKIVGTFSL